MVRRSGYTATSGRIGRGYGSPMPVPAHYFEIIRCPRCRDGRLRANAETVACVVCGAVYPVAGDIPVLLTELDDVSRQMQDWYERNWVDGKAKRAHEDTTELGQRYIQDGERPFVAAMGRRLGTYFVDLGCGAQPRVEAGRGHRFYVCVDLTMAGLAQAREMLGDRGIYVCGSLLAPPLAEGFASTALMAHCLYHIDRGRQPAVLRAAYDLLEASGELVVLYANPHSLEYTVTKPLRALKRRRGGFYFVPLPIPEMLRLAQGLRPAAAEIGTLRAVSFQVSQPLFAVLGRLGYRLLRLLDRLPPRLSTYVAYRVKRA